MKLNEARPSASPHLISSAQTYSVSKLSFFVHSEKKVNFLFARSLESKKSAFRPSQYIMVF